MSAQQQPGQMPFSIGKIGKSAFHDSIVKIPPIKRMVGIVYLKLSKTVKTNTPLIMMIVQGVFVSAACGGA